MATPKTVWGIDIGQVALKAVKLRSHEGELQVEAFDIIEHSKILSEPDADKRQLIRSALEQFLARNNVSDSRVAVAVPGQSSFTRFVKLPPVDAKKVPDIVRYEAEQQIPFPIDDVIWRWQTFVDPDSPDMEVGIFAMKQVDVRDMIERFTDVGLNVDFVQMAPLALYNFLLHDAHASDEGATLLADVGADKTDLIVADGPRMWTRTIQIGGNQFTEALVKAFKLSFANAEKLKRTATTSKYAKQVFQAMRPVFADLVQEIQRSIGYYTASHRDTRFKKIVGLGNGFRLPGLQKFLEQNLNIAVVPVDSYNKAVPGAAVSAPQLNENTLSLAVAYGLALQGLGLSPIQTNLLPEEITNRRLWARKRPWFAATAACLLMALAMPWYDNNRVITVLEDPANTAKLAKLQRDIQAQQQDQGKYRDMQSKIAACRAEIKNYQDLYNSRVVLPALQGMIWGALAQSSPDQKLIQNYIDAPAAEENQKTLKLRVKEIKAKPRGSREIIFVDKIEVEYLPNVANAPAVPGAAPTGNAAKSAPSRPGFLIKVAAWTPLRRDEVSTRLFQIVRPWTVEYAKKHGLFLVKSFEIVDNRIGTRGELGAAGAVAPAAPAGGGATTAPVVKVPDPWLDGEESIDDTVFTLGWIVELTPNAQPAPQGRPEAKEGGQNAVD